VRPSSIFVAGALVAGLAISAGVTVPSAKAAVPSAGAAALAASSTAVGNTAATTTPAPAGSWGTAQAVPGPESVLGDVSCAPGGACVAVGNSFSINSGPSSFMITEQGGTWSKPQQVPGLAALGASSFPVAEQVACPAKGDCLVAGEYGSNTVNGFVVQETGGKWGSARAIPGLAALDTAQEPNIDSVSCPAPGYCTVTGDYATGSTMNPSGFSSFVVDEVNYTWRTAQQVPGLAALNVGGDAGGAELSCRSPQNCTLVGGYAAVAQPAAARSALGSATLAMRHAQLQAESRAATRAASLPARLAPGVGGTDLGGIAVYVDSEVNGVWQQAAAAPALPGQTTAGAALPSSNVACASAGNCVVGGAYIASPTATTETGFLLTQSGGNWTVSTALHGMLGITTLACPSPGNCVAGGLDAKEVAAVSAQSGGTWGTAAELKGAAGLTYKGKKAQASEVDALACPRAGNCTAAGSYAWNLTSSSPGMSAFVATEVNGTWSAASAPAAITALNSAALGGVAGVSCAAAANCAVVGEYATSKGLGSFVLAEIPLKLTSTAQALSAGKVSYGKESAEHVSVHVMAAAGTPGGKVTVKAGSKVICVITLKAGKGSCTLTARQLAKGTYHLQASYPGAFGFGASVSKLATLTVTG